MSDYSSFSKDELLIVIKKKELVQDYLESRLMDLEKELESSTPDEEYNAVTKSLEDVQEALRSGLTTLEWVLTYLYKGDTQEALIHLERAVVDLKSST